MYSIHHIRVNMNIYMYIPSIIDIYFSIKPIVLLFSCIPIKSSDSWYTGKRPSDWY